MLTSHAWQLVPGTCNAWVYPCIRRPDILSSNAYLIRTPEQLTLIDPGALPAQSAELLKVTEECRQDAARPMVVLLTHCHLDHCQQTGVFQENQTMPAWIAIQEQGADALSRMDARSTAADIYGLAPPLLKPDIRLLTRDDRQNGKQRLIRLSRNVLMSIDTVPLAGVAPHSREQSKPVKQIISMGGGEILEAYSTPGHTPDSLCFRLGGLLFVGDLMAALSPLVAGIYGWDRKDLTCSLERVVQLLDAEPIQLCCPGHGAILTARKTKEMLLRGRTKVETMNDISAITEERLFQTTELALELIDEAEEAFSAMAGRLLFVAHQLESLEESEAAQRCRKAMPMDQIDACLDAFRKLCQTLDRSETSRLVFTHEALHIVKKISRLFDHEALAPIIPATLINRARCLLLDFIGVARGYRNLEEFVPVDLNALVQEADRTWRSSPHLDEAIMEHVEDRERYLAELVRRIGHPPPAERVSLAVATGANTPFVRAAAARLLDTLVQFLEWLSLAMPACIVLRSDTGPDGPFMAIIPENWSGLQSRHQERVAAAFARRFRIAGMVLENKTATFRLASVPALT